MPSPESQRIRLSEDKPTGNLRPEIGVSLDSNKIIPPDRQTPVSRDHTPISAAKRKQMAELDVWEPGETVEEQWHLRFVEAVDFYFSTITPLVVETTDEGAQQSARRLAEIVAELRDRLAADIINQYTLTKELLRRPWLSSSEKQSVPGFISALELIKRYAAEAYEKQYNERPSALVNGASAVLKRSAPPEQPESAEVDWLAEIDTLRGSLDQMDKRFRSRLQDSRWKLLSSSAGGEAGVRAEIDEVLRATWERRRRLDILDKWSREFSHKGHEGKESQTIEQRLQVQFMTLKNPQQALYQALILDMLESGPPDYGDAYRQTMAKELALVESYQGERLAKLKPFAQALDALLAATRWQFQIFSRHIDPLQEGKEEEKFWQKKSAESPAWKEWMNVMYLQLRFKLKKLKQMQAGCTSGLAGAEACYQRVMGDRDEKVSPKTTWYDRALLAGKRLLVLDNESFIPPEIEMAERLESWLHDEALAYQPAVGYGEEYGMFTSSNSSKMSLMQLAMEPWDRLEQRRREKEEEPATAEARAFQVLGELHIAIELEERMRRKDLNQWYRKEKAVENSLKATTDAARRTKLLAQLRTVKQQLSQKRLWYEVVTVTRDRLRHDPTVNYAATAEITRPWQDRKQLRGSPRGEYDALLKAHLTKQLKKQAKSGTDANATIEAELACYQGEKFQKWQELVFQLNEMIKEAERRVSAQTESLQALSEGDTSRESALAEAWSRFVYSKSQIEAARLSLLRKLREELRLDPEQRYDLMGKIIGEETEKPRAKLAAYVDNRLRSERSADYEAWQQAEAQIKALQQAEASALETARLNYEKARRKAEQEQIIWGEERSALLQVAYQRLLTEEGRVRQLQQNLERARAKESAALAGAVAVPLNREEWRRGAKEELEARYDTITAIEKLIDGLYKDEANNFALVKAAAMKIGDRLQWVKQWVENNKEPVLLTPGAILEPGLQSAPEEDEEDNARQAA